MKKKDNLLIYDIPLRYLLILILGFTNLVVFYSILTTPTIKLSSFLLNLVSEAIPVGNFIIFNNVAIEIIDACVAGSAFYLLFMLIFLTADIPFIKRFYIFLFLSVILFLFNVLRIVILILLTNSVYFDYFHMFFWYVLSTIFVIALWFLAVKLFKIKAIPLYTDIKNLLKQIKK